MIHPTAIIEPGAQLGDHVRIGAYAFIGSKVRIGDECDIRHHASIEGNTELAARNIVFPYACIGFQTQDLKYNGGAPGLRVGSQNIFREFCTIHCATRDGDFTTIGSGNTFLAYSHVGHDCVIGDHCILSNNATLAGHVRLEDHVIISGLAGIHQFCRIGAYAFLGGCAKVVQDVPPYMMADGNPAEVRTINKVGLERNGFDREKLGLARAAFKAIYREGLNRSQALARLESFENAHDPLIQHVIRFVRESDRGLA